MTDHLDSHRFEIVSLAHGHLPIGIPPTKLERQIVRVGAPLHDWAFHKVEGNRFRLKVAHYPYTGAHGHGGNVVASTHREDESEWLITRHEHQNGYTIALAKEPHIGWTVATNVEEHHEVEVQPIRATASIPPQFSPTQLFSLRKID